MHALLPLIAAIAIAAPAPYLIRDVNDAPVATGHTASALRDRSGRMTLEWDPWLAVLPSGVIFEAVGSDGVTRLWSSDGTAAGTVPLAAVDAYQPFVAGAQVFFLVRPDGRAHGLWRSDGTPAGTGPVPVPSVPDTYPEPIGVLGDRLLMANSYGGGFRDLWITDGSADGTYRLGDSEQPSSSPEDVVGLGAHVLFTANGDSGRELWSTDGTPAGTAPVVDLTPGAASTFVIGGAQLTVVGDGVLFPAAGTLWRSDGTAAGTIALAGIGASAFAAFFATADHLFFQPDATPPVLWASDGSAAGTGPIAEGLHTPRFVGAVAGRAIFLATDDGGDALWASDGTAAGTHRLRALASDRARAFTGACLVDACVFAAVDAEHGSEPWRSDGTEPGTALLADVQPGAGASHPYGFAVAGSRVAFLADDGVHGIEPWTTSGAPGNTRLVADIAPGAASSELGIRDEAHPLLATTGAVFLGADDSLHGREPWAIPLSVLAPAGDCDDDGTVTVAELVRAVGIALGAAPLATCPVADADADGTVAIADLIAAVNAAL